MEIIYSLAASIFYSASHVSVKQGVSQLGTPVGTGIMLIAGTITIVLISVMLEGFQVVMTASVSAIIYFTVAGIIHFIGGWGFLNASSSRIGPARVGVMVSLTPLFATALAFITLNETLNYFTVLGIMILTIGVYLTITSKS